jgi:hypothetical protein
MFEEGLRGAPDTPENRNMRRLAATVQDKHHRAGLFLEGLGKPLPQPFAVAEEAKPIFLEVLQSVLDLLYDVTRTHQSGAAQFATLNFLYWSRDELTVAFYLAERKHTTQAYSHLRTAYELLEQAELFFRQPTWAEVWGSDDIPRIIAELSPGAVRKKLGKPKIDPFYSFLTRMGAHGTFEAVRKRVVQRGKDGNVTRVTVFIGGGVPWDTEVDVTVSICVLLALCTLEMTSRIYSSRLNAEDVRRTLSTRIASVEKFLNSYLPNVQKSTRLDVLAIMATLETIKKSVRSPSRDTN